MNSALPAAAPAVPPAPAATIIVAGLVILTIHLAFPPWPDIFRHRFGG